MHCGSACGDTSPLTLTLLRLGLREGQTETRGSFGVRDGVRVRVLGVRGSGGWVTMDARWVSDVCRICIGWVSDGLGSLVSEVVVVPVLNTPMRTKGA